MIKRIPAPPPGTYINGRRFSDEAERRLEEFENVCAELGVRLPPNFTVAQWLESHGMSRSHFDRLRQSAPHRVPFTTTDPNNGYLLQISLVEWLRLDFEQAIEMRREATASFAGKETQ